MSEENKELKGRIQTGSYDARFVWVKRTRN